MSINKVNGSFDPNPIGKPSKTSSSKGAEEAKEAGKAGADESAVPQLSSKSNELNAAPVDLAKVEAIKQGIRDGKFEVNAEAVASGIIKSAKELVGQA